MFNRPGRKVQLIAIVIFFINTLLGILVGYFVSNVLDAISITQSVVLQSIFGGSYPSPILVIIVFGLIGMIVGWLKSILLYAFGSFVDDVETIKKTLR